MGSRSPDAGADVLLTGRIRLWVGCEYPLYGLAYHIAAEQRETITQAEWLAIRSALVARDVAAFRLAVDATPAASWWDRAAVALRVAWGVSAAVPCMWQPPTSQYLTDWTGPTPVYHY